jgi:DNA-binding response OmpR family regulator
MARILVIDDDQLFVKLMVRTLEQRGHEVAFALDGSTGERMFSEASYDAVVCDIVMPEQEGVQTIRHIRTRRPDIGIVAISGGLSFGHTGNVDVLDIADKFGADVTLKKPFQLPELAAAVDQVLAKRTPAQAAQT